MRERRQHKLPDEDQLELIPLADIARGGMGKVQLARVGAGRIAGKHVAVKRLNRELEREQAYVDMFLDETWMTSVIKSPNVIGVEAWGHDKHGMYLAIELVQGVSLARLIKESRAKSEPFAERTVACLLSQVCAGLEVAHDVRSDTGEHLGLVHRDLTPGNVLVGFDGVVKIADFGIAKARSRLTETAGGVMKGKPAYMAPEQARGLDVDRRADLFAVGVIMYELLAGKRPWTGADDLETLIAVTTTEPVDLAELRRASDVFLTLARQLLRKNRDERPASAREVRERLDTWRTERGFVADDFTSLAQFVQRNTPEQMAWFSRALSGGQKADAPTFKEVEEKLDRDRGIARTGDPRASGTRRAAPATDTQPRHEPPPPHVPVANPLASTQVAPGSLAAPSTAAPAPWAMPQPPSSGPAPSGAPGSSGPKSPSRLASTIAMPEASPYRPVLPTTPMASAAAPARPRSHSPYPAFQPSAPAERRMAEPQPEVEIVAPTVAMHHDAPPASAPPRPSELAGETTSLGSVLVVRKKSSRATFIVLGLVVLLVAATLAAYLFRSRFLG